MNSQISETSFYKKHPYYLKDSEIYYPESDGEPMAETDFHINLIIYLQQALEAFFADRPDVYVSGCIMLYYIEGAPDEVVSPDVMVCFGVPKGNRRTYKVWEESDVIPSVIFEITSRKTLVKDRIEKRQLYEMLGVQEYFILNPEPTKQFPALIAYRLENGRLEMIPIESWRVHSELLGLDIVDTGNSLRLFNPNTDKLLPTAKELFQENVALKAEIERLKKLLEKQ